MTIPKEEVGGGRLTAYTEWEVADSKHVMPTHMHLLFISDSACSILSHYQPHDPKATNLFHSPTAPIESESNTYTLAYLPTFSTCDPLSTSDPHLSFASINCTFRAYLDHIQTKIGGFGSSQQHRRDMRANGLEDQNMAPNMHWPIQLLQHQILILQFLGHHNLGRGWSGAFS